MMWDAVYAPEGRSGEYSEWACNLFDKCVHGCLYCYAPCVRRMDRAKFHEGDVQPYKGVLGNINACIARDGARMHDVLLCFTSDPCQTGPLVRNITVPAIGLFHQAGISVQILTKGKYGQYLLQNGLTQGDSVATSLAVPEDRVRDWEPFAASVADRIALLRSAREMGYRTWVSLEPILNPDWSIDLAQLVLPYVDEIKTGPLNHLNRLSLPPERKREVVQADLAPWPPWMDELEARAKPYGTKVYFKKDLLALAE